MAKTFHCKNTYGLRTELSSNGDDATCIKCSAAVAWQRFGKVTAARDNVKGKAPGYALLCK